MLARSAFLFVDRLRQSEAGSSREHGCWHPVRAHLTFFTELNQNAVNGAGDG
jgi:hypothetical protein